MQKISILAFAAVTTIATHAGANPLLDGFFGTVSAGATAGTFSGVYESSGNDFPGDGSGEIDGEFLSISIGYDYDLNDKLFAGGELFYKMQDVVGSEECPNPNWDCGFEVNNNFGLRARLGTTLPIGTSLYGIVGYFQGDATAFVISPDDERFEDEKSFDGYEIGLGVEHPVAQQLSVRGQVIYQTVNEEVYEPTGRRSADAELVTVEFGAVYRF